MLRFIDYVSILESNMMNFQTRDQRLIFFFFTQDMMIVIYTTEALAHFQNVRYHSSDIFTPNYAIF